MLAARSELASLPVADRRAVLDDPDRLAAAGMTWEALAGWRQDVMDAPPDLSLFAFHVTWPGATLEQEDAATRALMDRTTQRGRAMVTGAEAHGRFLGRVCVLRCAAFLAGG